MATPKPAADVVVGIMNIPNTAKSKPTKIIFFTCFSFL
jgi:hypothetical protein